jgi:ABC-2 type transport system ATP-binding protein
VADDRRNAAAHVLPALLDAGIDVPELSLGQPTLDEVFLALTGEPVDEAAATDEAATTEERR